MTTYPESGTRMDELSTLMRKGRNTLLPLMKIFLKNRRKEWDTTMIIVLKTF
jgi:hypothetical protein